MYNHLPVLFFFKSGRHKPESVDCFTGIRITERLIELYKGGGEYGRPPYDPAVILKMLLINY